MVEAPLVLLDALDVCEEALAGEGVGDAAGSGGGVGFGVHGVDDEGPVHHLVAVEEVAVQDELQGGVQGVGVVVGGFEV